MDLEKIPTWAWGVGGAVALLALLQSRNSGSTPTVTTVGPVANANASATLDARVQGFDKLTGFASDLVGQETTLAQTQSAQTVAIAGINAQTAAAQLQANTQATTAQITADTERARIAAAQQTANTQGANQLAATRSQAKASTFSSVVSTIGNVVSGVLHFL